MSAFLFFPYRGEKERGTWLCCFSCSIHNLDPTIAAYLLTWRLIGGRSFAPSPDREASLFVAANLLSSKRPISRRLYITASVQCCWLSLKISPSLMVLAQTLSWSDKSRNLANDVSQAKKAERHHLPTCDWCSPFLLPQIGSPRAEGIQEPRFAWTYPKHH